MKKLAVLTSGGDAPGMNAAIRAVVRAGIYYGMEVFGVQHGYQGLTNGSIHPMSLGSVADIIHRGGTILQTSRSREFMIEEGRKQAFDNLKQQGIENLIVIGGKGTLNGAFAFSPMGIKVIGIPASIDNDIILTRSIGFDTAVNTVLEAINRVRDTATSHGRVFIIEVMGGDCGEIALAAGLAGGAESILIPEIATNFEQIVAKINNGMKRGKLHSIMVLTEGVYPIMELKKDLQQATNMDIRVTILGHVQRGGTPTASDRILASCMGKEAVVCINNNLENMMIAENQGRIYPIPLAEVINGKKSPESNMFALARILSI